MGHLFANLHLEKEGFSISKVVFTGVGGTLQSLNLLIQHLFVEGLAAIIDSVLKLARTNQLNEVLLNLINVLSEFICDLLKCQDFVGLDVLLEGFESDISEHIWSIACMLTNIWVIPQCILYVVKASLELHIISIQEMLNDKCYIINWRCQYHKVRGFQHGLPQLFSIAAVQGSQAYVVS